MADRQEGIEYYWQRSPGDTFGCNGRFQFWWLLTVSQEAGADSVPLQVVSEIVALLSTCVGTACFTSQLWTAIALIPIYLFAFCQHICKQTTKCKNKDHFYRASSIGRAEKEGEE